MADNQLVIKIDGDIREYQDALQRATEETEGLQKTLNTIAKTGAVAFAGLGAAILFAAKSAGKFETIEAQFETLLGSTKAAKAAIKELSDFTAKTPFQFDQVAQAGKKLLAFGIQSDDLRAVLGRLGDVSAATGADFGELSLIFGQVRAAGKLTGERLLQLEERAIPIGPALAKTMGVAETSIRDLVSKGEVSFKTFEKAFASLSEKGGLAFEGMAKRSKTFEGQLSTLSDNFDLVVGAIGQNFLPMLKQLTKALTNVLEFIRENPGLTDFIAKMLIAGTVTGGLLTTVALGATLFLKLRAAIIASTLATRGLSFAVKGLIGATGFGLLIAFLPEILEVFKWVFSQSLDVLKRFGRTLANLAKAWAKIMSGIFTFSPKAIKKGLQQAKDAFADTAFKLEKIRKKNVEAAKKEAAELAKIEADKKKAAEEAAKKKSGTEKKAFDKKSQRLADENELIKAQLAGIEKEELAFIKKRQEIKQKERDAQVIQDEGRRKLALENVKLSNDRLLKEEKDLAVKRAELQRKKEESEFEAFTDEIALKQQAMTAEDEREQREIQRQTDEEARRQERIQGISEENEILKAQRDKLENEEIEFLRRRQKLRTDETEAKKITNKEEQTSALENIQLKNEMLLTEESEFFLKRDELRAEQQEKEADLQEELAQLSAEQRAALQENELQELRDSLQTKEQIRTKAAKKELLDRRKEMALREADESKHGKAVATFRAFMRSEEFSNTQSAANALAQLQQSENAEMKAIGKAAAIVQIGINTQKGAIAAYSALAGIPIVGPALGVAAAAALVAFGAERAVKVQAAQAGGIVAGSGFGDRIPFLLEPGELITPRQNFEEVVNAVTERRIIQRETEEGLTPGEEDIRRVEVDIGFDGEEAADVLTVRQNEQQFLGTSQAF